MEKATTAQQGFEAGLRAEFKIACIAPMAGQVAEGCPRRFTKDRGEGAQGGCRG